MKRILLILSFFIFNQAVAIEFKGKFIQGHFIIGKTVSGKKIFIDKKEVKVNNKGFFVFGLNKDRKNDVLIEVVKKNVRKKIIKKESGSYFFEFSIALSEIIPPQLILDPAAPDGCEVKSSIPW